MTNNGPSVRELMRTAATAASNTSSLASGAASPHESNVTPLAMLKELVRQLNEAAGLSLTADDKGYCLMESINGLHVMISLHDEGSSLLLTAGLGDILGDLPEACRILLEANAFGRSSLGGCFGLLPDSTSVVYQYVLQDLSRAPAQVLLPVLKSFVEHGEKVRDLIAAGGLGKLNVPQI